MAEYNLPVVDVVVERALQGYAPENVQQVSALVLSVQSVLPIEDFELELGPLDEIVA